MQLSYYLQFLWHILTTTRLRRLQSMNQLTSKHSATSILLHGMGALLEYTIIIDRDGHEISCFGGLPQELYLSKGLYIVPRENVNILAPPTHDISSVPVDICYIRWSKLRISSKFDGALWLPRSLVSRLGVCVQNKLNANFTALRAFYVDVLLLTTAYSTCAVQFFLGQLPNMELMLLLLSPLFLIELLYFPGRSI